MPAPAADEAVASCATADVGSAHARLPASTTAPSSAPASSSVLRWWLGGISVLALVALGLAWQVGQQQRAAQAEFAKRQTVTAEQASEARVLAREAEAAARDAAAKVALLDARLAEVALQRTQLEDLIQALSRSRDENLLADLEAALRVAMQQVAITGSTEPLLAALRQADERLARQGAQPRLDRVRRAVAGDLEKVRASGAVDIPGLSIRIDELVRQVDEWPMLSSALTARQAAKPTAAAAQSAAPATADSGPRSWMPAWLGEGGRAMLSHGLEEVRSLVRVTRVQNPEAALAAPEQAFFVRENLKLRLLNARLSALSRQFDAAQSDLREAEALLLRYFDRSSRRVDAAAASLRQLAQQARVVVVPNPEATLAALASVAGSAR
jgi:uroporphyrin-III C-methyltransferase